MKRSSLQSGFSLIELLVSMTVFSVVMAMAASTLLVLLDANSKAQNMQAVLNDLTVAIDSLTREIRTGYNYYCRSRVSTSTSIAVESITDTQDCNSGANGNYLSVVEAGSTYDSSLTGSPNGRIAYIYDSATSALYRRINDGAWVRITSPSVTITEAQFIVRNTNSTDKKQPNVTLYLKGEAGDLAETDAEFVIQSSITQRLLDI